MLHRDRNNFGAVLRGDQVHDCAGAPIQLGLPRPANSRVVHLLECDVSYRIKVHAIFEHFVDAPPALVIRQILGGLELDVPCGDLDDLALERHAKPKLRAYIDCENSRHSTNSGERSRLSHWRA